jgi:3-deoxy-manno-octulosonate cytidylyltransferase (CMP-KDO synthetase)
MNPIIVIPARMASTRLPGKPLALIAGRPMILHVWERAMRAGIGPVAVACCEAAVAEAVAAQGGRVVMTEPDLPSGSDRVQAALAVIDPEGTHDVVINLQGDLPSLPPHYLATVLEPLADEGFDLATLVAPVASEEEARSESVVKAVCAFPAALYFSRACVPWGAGPLWHHVGIYAWRRTALARFVALPPSPLELREKLEQLRALEAGMRIGAARVDHAPFGVDTPADLARANQDHAQ